MSTKSCKSEEKILGLLDFIADPVVIVDRMGTLLEVNTSFEEITGLRREKAIGKNIVEFGIFSEKIIRIFRENLEKRIMGLDVKPYKIKVIAKNGKTINLEVRAKKIDYAGQPADFVVFRVVTQRKRNERRLKEYAEKLEALVDEKENNEKLEKIFDSSPDAIAVSDLNAKINECNQAALDMFGYSSREEVIGKSLLEFVASSNQQRVAKDFEEMIVEQDTARNIEYAFLAKNGREFLGEISASSIRDSSGNLAGFVVIIKDITERKQLEDALHESEEMFRAISTSALDAIILVDDASKIVYWNPAAEKMFDYTNEAIIGKDIADAIVPPAHREFFLKFLKEPFETIEQFRGTTLSLSALRKDGEEFPMELSVSLLMLDNKIHLLGLVRDVSERKKMEDAIKQERDMLESVTRNIGAGFAIISKDYHVLWSNNFIERYKGDTKGKLCYAVLNSLDAPCPDCGLKRIFEDGAATDSHEYSATIDGEPFWVELIVSPIKDKDGNVIAASELAIDITERKRMQGELAEYSMGLERLVEERTAELKQAQAKLLQSERMAAIGELAGMVGHDLRNPLTGIKNAAYYLKKKWAPNADASEKEMLEVIDSAINHANRIISDLLDYSREMHLEPIECTPHSLLKEALPMIQIPDNTKIADYTLDEPKIKADVGKIVRVFINLIKNAVDAMPEGGTLEIRSTTTNGNLNIAFTDTGKGISEEVMAKLFTPLFTTKAQGMGFGLAICKRVVEAHGGKITVKSTVDKGTTFTITLPIEPKLEKGGEK
jgi:PAS domain S-box-containing protein